MKPIATAKIVDSLILVSFVGDLDENANLESVSLPPDKLDIKIDCEELRRINSVGVREWLRWINKIPKDRSLVLVHCHKPFIDQCNMISEFLPANAKVESFYVPYVSSTVDEERMVLFRRDQEYVKDKIQFPFGLVDSTGQELEMDVIPNRYFAFLKKYG